MLLANIVTFLGLKKPYKVIISSRRKKTADADYLALYTNGGEGELHSHQIRVFMGNNSQRSLETLIAHELLHAWQEENNLDDIHGKPFQAMADLITLHFGIENIYIPGTDK